jgi:copper homeostasis protein
VRAAGDLIPMKPILIEACVDSVAAAAAAEAGGAARVELCVSLSVGGLTPPDSLVRECVRRLSIPVFVLVRPRAGSFVVAEEELQGLLAQVRRATALGAAGIVSGVLTAEGGVDGRAMTAVVAAAAPLPVTFHRAFDEIGDQAGALEALIALGVSRVLTSGGAPTALEGAERIGSLVRQAAGRIGILPGGTVRALHARTLVARTGVSELHSRTPADPEAVRALVHAANGRPSVS